MANDFAGTVNQLAHRVGLDWAKATAVFDDVRTLEYELGIAPGRFLDFAKRDLEANDDRALVNALSNAKRAIDAEVDTVLMSFGLRVGRLGIQQKVELLQQLSVAAPRIIRKTRDARNLLEHEYHLPSQEQVEDAVDIATLFIAACSGTLVDFPVYVLLANADTPEDMIHRYRSALVSRFDDDRCFTIGGVRELEPIKDKIAVAPSGSLHLLLLCLHMATKRGEGVKEAIEAIQDCVRSGQL